jgi:hypothetical protein
MAKTCLGQAIVFSTNQGAQELATFVGKYTDKVNWWGTLRVPQLQKAFPGFSEIPQQICQNS